MKINGINIDGFGVWHDRCWDGLSGAVNVFYGPNEAGKTTLMSFIRSVLFGFERRKHPRRYEPLSGGKHGGSLQVVQGGEDVRIERQAGRHVRGQVQVHRDAGTGDETELERMLAGTTRTLYHNVFAFGLEELEQFRTLQEHEVAAHISGAGMGVGASRWSAVSKDLVDRQSSLFLPRGQNATINRELRELEAVRAELDRTESEPLEYVEAHQQRASLEVEVSGLEESVERLGKVTSHYEKLRQAEPYRKRRRTLQQQLDTLEVVERFPEGGVARLNLLTHQRRQLDAEMAAERTENRELRSERADLAARYTPQELLRRNRVVDGLRTYLSRLESADELLVRVRASNDAVEAENAAAFARREVAGPPSGVATIAFATVVAVVAATLFWSDNLIAGGGVLVSLLLIGFWYYQRTRRVALIDSEISSISSRLQTSWTAANDAEIERNKIRSVLEELAGRREVSYADLERHTANANTLARMADRIRSIDESMASEERHRGRLEARVGESDRAIRALLVEAGVDSESEFFRRAETFVQRRKIVAELERTPSGEVPTRDSDLVDIDHLDADRYGESKKELLAATGRLGQLRKDIGRLEERIETLSRSEERSRARIRQEAIVARMDEASSRWAVLTLCRTLLDETRRVYETERQPEVLKHASEFLAHMSNGRWNRVIAPLGSDELIVESEGGSRISPENLSRGTAEQLYLAMRLALVGEYSNHVEPLPVIFDDIFVNFDRERTQRAIESIKELSKTHQVLMFTCHPHMVELVEEVVPEAAVFSL
jgi:uncharacterized protein YhaN